MIPREIDSLLPAGSYYFSGNEAAAEGAIAAGCRLRGLSHHAFQRIMERMPFDCRDGWGVHPNGRRNRLHLLGVGACGRSQSDDGNLRSRFQPHAGGHRLRSVHGNPPVSFSMCKGRTRHRPGDPGGKRRHMQAKWGSHGDYQVIALSPWSVREMYRAPSRPSTSRSGTACL